VAGTRVIMVRDFLFTLGLAWRVSKGPSMSG
jgi:hypothetical protein